MKDINNNKQRPLFISVVFTKETRQNEKAHVSTWAQNLVSVLHLKKRNHNISPISRESTQTSPFKATSNTPHENITRIRIHTSTTKGYKKYPRREHSKNHHHNDIIADTCKTQSK